MRYLRNPVKAEVSFIYVASIASVITKWAVSPRLIARCDAIARDFYRNKADPRELFSPLSRTAFVSANGEEKSAVATLSERL